MKYENYGKLGNEFAKLKKQSGAELQGLSTLKLASRNMCRIRRSEDICGESQNVLSDSQDAPKHVSYIWGLSSILKLVVWWDSNGPVKMQSAGFSSSATVGGEHG